MRKAISLTLIGIIVMTIGFSALPLTEVITTYSEQHTGSMVTALQYTFLIAFLMVAIGLFIARPGFARMLGYGGLGFVFLMIAVAVAGYLMIGAVLGG